MTEQSTDLSSLLRETRCFEPPPEFVAGAVAKPSLYEEAARDRIGFWEDQARCLSCYCVPPRQSRED